MRVIGVDFSGAGSYESVGKTWIARGELDGDGVLTIESCQPISREGLTGELEGLAEPAVVGMDFPFSVPEVFARCWKPSAREMPDLWVKAACMEWNNRDELRNKLHTDKFAGLKRDSDPSGAIAPLNIRMVQMTFRGMQMLNRLWERPEIRVLPLQLGPEQDSVILLEVMPGATIRSLVGRNLHKSYKNGNGWMESRLEILAKLPEQVRRLTFSGLTERRELCLGNDDAMDAIIAAVTAALWQIDTPPERNYLDYPDSSLAGWMYVPRG